MFVSPTVVGKAVILGSCAGTLYALDRTTGAPIWLYHTSADGSAAQFHGEPLLIGDRVVIPTDSDPKGYLYSFDAASGDLLWKIAFNQGIATTPLFIDGRVVAVSAEGEVVAVDPKNGAVVWQEAPAGGLKPLPYTPSPAYAAKRIFVADNTTRLFSLDAATGATLWRKTLPARMNTALIVVGKTLVLGTEDGYLNWIAIDSGEVKKRIRLEEGHPYGTPILAPPLLFVLAAGEKGTLFALDAESGAIRWKQETPKEWTTYRPLVTGSTVIVGSTEKNLCAFDRASGEARWCRSVGQTPRGLGISSDGILYVGSLSGVVQAYRISTADAR
ncbi:MAG TPA: PQQ-binding-like beta-propeller repeat protein [Thermoanaerobaculia bacterium]